MYKNLCIFNIFSQFDEKNEEKRCSEDNGQLVITNAHIGSLDDILTYVIEVAPELNISKVQLLNAILQEMSKGGFSEDEESAFWDDFDNLQKAKIIR